MGITRTISRHMTGFIALKAPISIIATLTVASNVAHLITLVALLLTLVIKWTITSIVPGFITSVTRTVIFHFNVRTATTKLKNLMKMRKAGNNLQKLLENIRQSRITIPNILLQLKLPRAENHRLQKRGKMKVSNGFKTVICDSCNLWSICGVDGEF